MATVAADVEKLALVHVESDQVSPFPWLNPRHRFDATELKELEDSIKEEGGNLIPVLITDPPEGHPVETRYGLVYGERRWRATGGAGTKLRAIYHPGLTWRQIIKLAGIENLKRVDLSAIEKAHWYQLMMAEGGTTQEEIADLEGVEQSTISNILRLLELPEEIVDLIDEGKLAHTNARDLLLPWMKENQDVRDKFFRIVAQQLDFGCTTGQHMSKPWLKEMVERVGKIAKPAPKSEAKPAAKPQTKKTPPAKEEKPTPPPATPAKAPEPEKEPAKPAAEKEDPPQPESSAEPDPPASEEAPEEVGEPPASPVELDLDAGLFAAATDLLVGKTHHLTFALMKHPNRAGEFSVIVTPKGKDGVPCGSSESAIGTAENIEDEVRAALTRFAEKINTQGRS